MNAAHYKHTKIIARLLEYGADRDLKDYDGHNALSRVDGDEMRYLIMNTKSFAEIAADAEKAKKAAAEAAGPAPAWLDSLTPTQKAMLGWGDEPGEEVPAVLSDGRTAWLATADAMPDHPPILAPLPMQPAQPGGVHSL